MKVELINYTQDALETLLYTKNTRLQGGESIESIKRWPEAKKMEHFAYMLDTIQSSFEFVNYTFKISEVDRAFTHQLVRTRTGSYAQESQRTVDASNAEVLGPDNEHFNNAVDACSIAYTKMIEEGVQIQDARNILPTGVMTSIIAQFDLRTIHNMALVRLCTRTQGLYQKVFKAMKDEIVKVHPWADDFIKVHCAWYGICAFPRYTECPIYEHTIHGEQLAAAKIKVEDVWKETEHAANPIAKGGVTQ